MPGRALASVKCIPCIRRIPHTRPLHNSQRFTNVTLPLRDVLETPASVDKGRDLLRARKIADLLDSLSRIGNSSRVWAYYIGVLNFLRYEKLPLELHQEVLRKCTPPSAQIRVAASRRLALGNKPSNAHVHEGRFQTIIRNIRSLGAKPTLDDYHFILEQFAAVGHHTGAIQVYKELTHLGLQPRTKTFGLCLQAIAHRLTLPCLQINRPRLLSQVRKMNSDILNDMRKYGVAFTSVNFDLTVRILKESVDREGCELLLKMGYGIDLANPDRPALEYLHDTTTSRSDLSKDRGESELVIPELPSPQPFSTAALNTTIDMLGRLGEVSKLVQAFEVLTQPLPPQASQHFSSSFDDDDDDYSVSTHPPSPQKITLPHATPNTTTYNTLLRYVSRAGHAVLARHYILEAMELDRKTDSAIRRQLHFKVPLEEIIAPHFAINRGTLLPAFGEANRDKNVGLMRWIQSKLPKILRRKRNDLAFYSRIREGLHAAQTSIEIGKDGRTDSSTHEPTSPIVGSSTPISSNQASSSDQSLDTQPTSSTSPPSLPGRLASVLKRTRWEVPEVSSVFDVDLDAPPPPPLLPTIKYFAIDLHLWILQRDIDEIEAFASHVADVLGRSTQRVKERLGRRVWLGKDIYLRTQEQRIRVSRPTWNQVVQFKPRLKPNLSGADPRKWGRDDSRSFGQPGYFLQNKELTSQPGWVAGRRGLSTLCKSRNIGEELSLLVKEPRSLVLERHTDGKVVGPLWQPDWLNTFHRCFVDVESG